MKRIQETRRTFLKQASVAALAFPFILNCKSEIAARTTESDLLAEIKKNAVADPSCN